MLIAAQPSKIFDFKGVAFAQRLTTVLTAQQLSDSKSQLYLRYGHKSWFLENLGSAHKPLSAFIKAGIS